MVMNVPFLRLPTIGLSAGLPLVMGCDRTFAGGFGSLILAMVVSQRSTSRKLSGAVVVELFDEVELLDESVAVELVEASGEVDVSRSDDELAVESDDGSVTVGRFDESFDEEVLEAFAPASVVGICPVVADLESIDGDGWSIAIVVPPIAAKVTRLPIMTPGFLINDRRDLGSIMSCSPNGKIPIALCKNLQEKP
jgi:hypothetical protein